MTEHLRNFVNGEWRNAGAPESLKVLNPASAQVLAEVLAGVSFVQLDAQHSSRNRGGDNKPIVGARFAILVNGYAHRTVCGLGDLDEDRSWTQHDPHERRKTNRKRGYQCFSAPSVLCHVTPLSSAPLPGPCGSDGGRAKAPWPPMRVRRSERTSHKSSH